MCQRAVISPPQGCRIPPSLPMQIRKFFVYFGCNIVFFLFTILNIKNAIQQWSRTPMKKEDNEDKKRMCRISHLLWVHCVGWTEIIGFGMWTLRFSPANLSIPAETALQCMLLTYLNWLAWPSSFFSSIQERLGNQAQHFHRWHILDCLEGISVPAPGLFRDPDWWLVFQADVKA